VKRSILIYAGGGIGKSTRAAEAARWLWKKTGLTTRVVNADGGGTESAFAGLVSKGAAELWDLDTWNEASIFQVLDFASKGWWPEDTKVPNSRLLPPYMEWRQCPKCKEDAGGTGFQSPGKCAACGVAFGAGVLLPVQRKPDLNMEKVGCVVFEGLTAFGELLLRRLRTIDSGGGNSITDKAGEGKEKEFKISSPGMQHYGAAQSYIAQFVSNSRQIGVPLVIWTALELRSDDDGKPLYGPAGPGKKLTATCIPWFTDVLHLDAVAKMVNSKIVKNETGQEILERQLFLAPHFPADVVGYKFAAKTSAPFGGDMPSVIPADMGIFFEELDKAFAKAEAKLEG